MVIRIMVMGDKPLPPNSNELERKCENLRKILINEVDSFSLISIAIKIVMESGIDISKDRYKTETETDLVRRHAEQYLQHNGSVTLEMLRSVTA